MISVRKLFGVGVLLVAFLLMSCGIGDYGKKGAVSFEIPVADIMMSRNADDFFEEEESEQQQYQYTFFLQLKGSNGYHSSKVETLILQENQESKEKTLAFSFDKLPVNQTYILMLDVFSQMMFDSEPEGHSLISYSGEQAGINLLAGETAYVDFTLSETEGEGEAQSFFDIKLDYLDGEEQKSKTIVVNSPWLDEEDAADSEFYIGYCAAEKKYYYRATEPEVDDKYGLGYSRECINQKRADWKELTDVSYVLKDNSHFGGFTFTVNTDDYSGEVYETQTIDLDFSDGICSVFEYMGESQIFNYPAGISKKFGSKTIEFSSWLPQLSFYSIEFETEKQENIEQQEEQGEHESIDESEETSFQEETAGIIQIEESYITFTQRGETNNGSARFVKGINLSEILGDKSLSDGDTVVFVLTPDQQNNSLADKHISQFYYQLQPEKWEKIEDQYLYDGNKCINLSDYSIIVMPLNSVKDVSDYNTLLMFFDCTSEESELNLSCSISYHIFPASTKTYVFGVGRNYDGSNNEQYPYRYEIDLPLTDSTGNMCTLEEGQTVSVTLNGTVKNYYQSPDGEETQMTYSSRYNFTAELYDGAKYTSSLGPNNEYFHPLSVDNVGSNKKSLIVTNGSFSGNGLFRFASIQAPFFDLAVSEGGAATGAGLPAHNYRFQCQTPCYSSQSIGNKKNCDPAVLLVIQNFKMTTEITPAQ